MKLFVQTGIGIVALIAGVSLLFLFFSGLSAGVNFIFLILSLVLIGAGAFMFVRVSKIENTSPESTNMQIAPAEAESGSKLLEKNNQLVQEWSNTTNKKDHLKAVQIAVSAEQQAKKEDQQ